MGLRRRRNPEGHTPDWILRQAARYIAADPAMWDVLLGHLGGRETVVAQAARYLEEEPAQWGTFFGAAGSTVRIPCPLIDSSPEDREDIPSVVTFMEWGTVLLNVGDQQEPVVALEQWDGDANVFVYDNYGQYRYRATVWPEFGNEELVPE